MSGVSYRHIAAAMALVLLAGCMQHDVSSCFGERPAQAAQTEAETRALADGQQRAEWCSRGDIQCAFTAEALPSGEILVWVKVAQLVEGKSRCMFPVDGDQHFLYTAQGEFKERIRSP